MTYKTFLRSATEWRQFWKARKITQATGLSWEEAKAMCKEYNDKRTARQKKKGTMMEQRSNTFKDFC